MSLDHAILGLLRESDMSGYDLKRQAFDDGVFHIWNADQAQIYRTLERLNARKLVSVKRIRQSARPDRKTWRLTDKGRKELENWLGTPRSHSASRNPFMLQMRLAEDLPNQALAEAILRERDVVQRRLDDLRATRASHERTSPKPLTRRDALHRMTLDGAIAQARSTIDWLDDCMELLGSSCFDGP